MAQPNMPGHQVGGQQPPPQDQAGDQQPPPQDQVGGQQPPAQDQVGGQQLPAQQGQAGGANATGAQQRIPMNRVPKWASIVLVLLLCAVAFLAFAWFFNAPKPQPPDPAPPTPPDPTATPVPKPPPSGPDKDGRYECGDLDVKDCKSTTLEYLTSQGVYSKSQLQTECAAGKIPDSKVGFFCGKQLQKMTRTADGSVNVCECECTQVCSTLDRL